MKIPVSSEIPTDRNDTPDLQDVLTRYIDSSREYSQAAGRMELAELSAMLGGIAARRENVARELAGLIRRQGGQPEQGASVAGSLRRAWLSLRRSIGGEHPGAVVADCIRGEEMLLTALEKALDSQEVTHGHAGALRIARDEVTLTIGSFQNIMRI
jgi:uncharacterized protein (TIGR02284 family)